MNKHQAAPKKHIIFSLLSFLIVGVVFILLALGMDELREPVALLKSEPVSLNPVNLVFYSMRTAFRMLIAVVISLIFSIIYASIAAKNKYAEQILIPLLDVLQSVPILGYISFTVTGFLHLFPNSMAGPEMAAIFAIFTSQVWNITFAFYYAFKGVPQDLKEASTILRVSPWQSFWLVDIPYAIPAVVFNVVISMSGGWFFVVASEVINVGNNHISLPGIGSYIALALLNKDIMAVFYAILAMIAVILLYNELILKPLICWSEKYKYDLSYTKEPRTRSWFFDLLSRSLWVSYLNIGLNFIWKLWVYNGLFTVAKVRKTETKLTNYSYVNINYFYIALAICMSLLFYKLYDFLDDSINLAELIQVLKLAAITTTRVIILVSLALLIWTPIGIVIGLNKRASTLLQPLAQFLSAFPVNILFPLMFMAITSYGLEPNIWLSFLMIMGSQWYILFNVIAGAKSIQSELHEASKIMKLSTFLRLRKLILPAIAPYALTGAITAAGGAWNASIVSEVIYFGEDVITADGLGSYIARMTVAADLRRTVLGITVMSVIVVLLNRILWRPLQRYINKRFGL